MKTTQAEIATRDGMMPAFSAAPDGLVRGAIVVIHEVFGLTSYIESVCQRLAAKDWFVIAPALFHRDGSPVVNYTDPAPGVALMHALTATAISSDLDATVAHLGGIGFSGQQIGTVGFCMGGTIALYFATTHSLGAAVTFYGVGIRTGQAGLPPLIELAPKLRCPWLGCYGAQDTAAPPEQVADLRAAAALAVMPNDVLVYPDAGHAFHCDARPGRFNAPAADDAWRQSLQLFENHVR